MAEAPVYGEAVVFGPFFRLYNEATQNTTDVAKILASGELWGRPPRNSDIPAVQAYRGMLPDDHAGFEFYAFSRPDQPWGKVMYWRERPASGVEAVGDAVRIRIVISRVKEPSK